MVELVSDTSGESKEAVPGGKEAGVPRTNWVGNPEMTKRRAHKNSEPLADPEYLKEVGKIKSKGWNVHLDTQIAREPLEYMIIHSQVDYDSSSSHYTDREDQRNMQISSSRQLCVSISISK